MITVLPRPKFSLKWEIDLIQCPIKWASIIESTLIWSLSQEKRYRDRFIGLKVRFVSFPYMKKIYEKYEKDDLLLVFKSQSKINLAFREINNIGEIVCSSSMIHNAYKDKDLFPELISLFADAGIKFLHLQDREIPAIKRKILAKYGAC